MYRGPVAALVTGTGAILPAGVAQEIALEEIQANSEELFVFDNSGPIINKYLALPACCPSETSGCCHPAGPSPARSISPEVSDSSCSPGPVPEARPALVKAAQAVEPTPDFRLETGCLVCGAPVCYLAEETRQTCTFCGKVFSATAHCAEGHFVCDACHTRNAEAFLEHICTVTTKTDFIDLLQEIRRHPAIPLHGPEHHIMVPGIILAAYRNTGGRSRPPCCKPPCDAARLCREAIVLVPEPAAPPSGQASPSASSWAPVLSRPGNASGYSRSSRQSSRNRPGLLQPAAASGIAGWL